MSPTERRPRIPDDIARDMEAQWPHIPFERLVRVVLTQAIEDDKRYLNQSLEDALYDLLLSDHAQMDWDVFEKAIAKVKKRWAADMKQVEADIAAEIPGVTA